MYATVGDLFALEIGGQLKLLAGKNALNKAISWTYVCQENVISPWVQGKEIMILYGAGIQRDIPSLVKLVSDCAEKKLSGIIVLVGYFITEIPDEMIAAADEYEIPLMEMPYNVPISKLTREIANLIMSSNTHYRQLEEALSDVFYGYEDSSLKLKQELSDFGYVWKKNNYIIAIETEDLNINDCREIEKGLCACFGGAVGCIISNRIIILVGSNSGGFSETATEICRDYLSTSFAKHLKFGIGNAAGGAHQLNQSYHNALNVISIAGCLEDNGKFYSYKKMPIIFKLMLDSDDDTKALKYCNDVLNPLLKYEKEHNIDLIETLHVFLSTNRNAKASAEKLYIHRNTMNYRLGLISTLTELDLSDAVNCFELRSAILIYKHLQKSQNAEK